MKPALRTSLRYSVLQVGSQRYAVLPEAELRRLAFEAGVALEPLLPGGAAQIDETPAFPAAVGPALIARRSALGLSQAELARRAEIRVETLNRIERGHTTPDFSTLRKLTIALKEVTAGSGRSRPKRNTKQEANR